MVQTDINCKRHAFQNKREKQKTRTFQEEEIKKNRTATLPDLENFFGIISGKICYHICLKLILQKKYGER